MQVQRLMLCLILVLCPGIALAQFNGAMPSPFADPFSRPPDTLNSQSESMRGLYGDPQRGPGGTYQFGSGGSGQPHQRQQPSQQPNYAVPPTSRDATIMGPGGMRLCTANPSGTSVYCF
jgi:hypothetical protein